MLKRFTFIVATVTIILLYLTGCTQPIQPEPGQPSNEAKLTFSYNLTGAFDSVVSRSSGESYSAKMYITDLSDSTTTEHPWTVFINRDKMLATSYNMLTIAPGNYSFELVVSKGGYNYHAKSGAIELKNGDNKIPLQLSPVIGDFITGTATVSDLEQLGDLVYRFSTIQLASITDPRLGYSINGSAEVIIKINKTTGLAPVKVNLTSGFHPTKLNFYEGTTLLGASKDGVNIYFNPAFALRKSNIDIYPLYGNLSLDTSLVDGKANFTISKLPRQLYDVMAARGGYRNEGIKAKVTFQYADYFTDSEIMLQADASGDHSGTGVIEGVRYGKANIIIDLYYKFTSDVNYQTDYIPFARAVTENVEPGQGTLTLNPTYRIFTKAYVDSNLKSVVNVSLYNYKGEPIIGPNSYDLELYADGKKVFDQKKVAHSINAAVNSDTQLIEIKKNGKALVQAFTVALKPFEVKNIEHTMPYHFGWSEVLSDRPHPFNEIVILNDNEYRLITVENAGKKEVILEKNNVYNWSKATPGYTVNSDEYIELNSNNYTIDSSGQLFLIIKSSVGAPQKIIRLSSNLSAWELMPYRLPADCSYIFSNSAGEFFTVYNVKNPQFKRLKADKSGWEDFMTAPVPATSPGGSSFSLNSVKTIFADREGNFCVEGAYGPSSYLLKYDNSTDSWKELFKTVEQRGNYYIDYTLDRENNFHVSTFKDEVGGAPPGMPKPYFSDYYVAKYNANGTNIFNNHMTSWKNEHVKTLTLLSHGADTYTLVEKERIAPYIMVTRAGVSAIDETLSQNIPLPGYGYEVEMGINNKGWVYLKYHNKTTGQTYYYKN